uniref:N-acetyltransferase domain-containing protein n=1 Tax=Strongyloides venezuelensis TaxID=75913 RepID=A0A0K0FIY6_STRVS
MNEKINNPIRYTKRQFSPDQPQLGYINWLNEKGYCKKFWMTSRNCVTITVILKKFPRNDKQGSVIDLRKFEDVRKSSLVRAPLILNHWFDEHKNYKWNTLFESTEAGNFTAMQTLKQTIEDHRFINSKNLLITKISSINARIISYPKTRKCIRISADSTGTN